MDSFTKKYKGRTVNYDGVFGFQCVDLIKQYLYEKFGLRPGAWGNAIDYWTKTNPAVLKKFNKVKGSNAKKGDIVILKGLPGNKYGHIGIATGRINSKQVEILEQNGSTGNGKGKGGDVIRTRFVDRTRVAGLLRPKSTKKKVLKPVYYTAKAGDYLGKIARKFKTTLKNILNLNPKKKKNPNKVDIGEKIKVKK